ncbi:low affinity immunoglobulin gamma Fc region receptor II-like isoform X1 [Salarias fasciatus]|uniref:low affinity immunoglobulin gamma Fc region receptor II-like isoform X1 n=1 Tax=Salarias fasciatus TaxID=181472 RepID=UPI001176B5B5|nr:low affinity immunoglobulin gamma Fc region receptor II-like isoform X1 [Salarias fasciatus]
MELTTLYVILGGFELFPLVLAVSLRVQPNRSQFFFRDSILLECDLEGNSSDWRVKKRRYDSVEVEDHCTSSAPKCFLDTLYPVDTGDYWCESEAGELSDAVSIIVTRGAVILESPALPVTEGETVTLICRSRDLSSSSSTSSGFSSNFYKNDLLIGSTSTGNLSVLSVSRSDEGLYKCNISGVGESSLSRLTVRAGRPEPTTGPLMTRIPFPVFAVCLAIVTLLLLGLSIRCTGEDQEALFYTTVIYTQRSSDTCRCRLRTDFVLPPEPEECLTQHTHITGMFGLKQEKEELNVVSRRRC